MCHGTARAGLLQLNRRPATVVEGLGLREPKAHDPQNGSGSLFHIGEYDRMRFMAASLWLMRSLRLWALWASRSARPWPPGAGSMILHTLSVYIRMYACTCLYVCVSLCMCVYACMHSLFAYEHTCAQNISHTITSCKNSSGKVPRYRVWRAAKCLRPSFPDNPQQSW